jgi:hypothetical protein
VEVVCEDDIILKNEEYIMVSRLRGNQHLSMGAVASSNSYPLVKHEQIADVCRVCRGKEIVCKTTLGISRGLAPFESTI